MIENVYRTISIVCNDLWIVTCKYWIRPHQLKNMRFLKKVRIHEQMIRCGGWQRDPSANTVPGTVSRQGCTST
jgi:hypothetical protein